MKQDIAQELQGYAVRQVRLEGLVDKVGYKPVIEGLTDLNLSGEHQHLFSPTPEFLDALSAKSKGLVLTSALLTGKEDLYPPLYSSAASFLGEMYSQDLPSLLGGSQAPSALSEMTIRATKAIGTLQDFSIGLTQISSARPTSSRLSEVCAYIASSVWVEAHPDESRGLMTLVNAASENMKIEPLKQNALGRYLKAGLKLASVAGVLAGIGLAGLYGGSFVHISGNVALVDLSTRPTIETKIAHGKTEQRKIVKFGEIAGFGMAKLYNELITSQTIEEAVDSFSSNDRVGYARLIDKGAYSEDGLCVVETHQVAKVSADGNFYLFRDSSSVISDKNMAEFYVKSHEVNHCFNWFDITEGGTENASGFELMYGQSLNEISSDLAAILDYMRVGGEGDLYADYLRPRRLAGVHDMYHKTAWALDEILKDVDPAAMRLKTAEEIPQITRFLMEKHFMAKDGSFSPRRFSASDGGTDVSSPAAKALWDELRAARWIMRGGGENTKALVSRYKQDIQSTISAQHSKYTGVAQADVMKAAADGYDELAKEYGLSPVEVVKVQKARIAKPMESMMSAFL